MKQRSRSPTSQPGFQSKVLTLPLKPMKGITT